MRWSEPECRLGTRLSGTAARNEFIRMGSGQRGVGGRAPRSGARQWECERRGAESLPRKFSREIAISEQAFPCLFLEYFPPHCFQRLCSVASAKSVFTVAIMKGNTLYSFAIIGGIPSTPPGTDAESMQNPQPVVGEARDEEE